VSEFVDAHYVTLLSGRLDKFTRKKADLYNFRCPYCGDSQKHKSKARGYFFRVKADMVYKCHNCGVGRTLSNFLKDQAPDLHDEYIMERYKKGTTGKGSYVPKPKFKKPVFKKTGDLESIAELNTKHPAVKYLSDRKIPEEIYGELFYTGRFYTWSNTQKPSFTEVTNDQPRIIIPFIDESGEWFGFQGRSLDKRDRLRYITIMLDENKPKIYGLNRVDKMKKSMWLKDRLTRSSWIIPLRWLGLTLIAGRLVGAIIFGFMITNLVTEKSSTGSQKQSIEVSQ